MGFDASFQFEGPVETSSEKVKGGGYQVRLTDEAGNRVSLFGLTVDQLDDFQAEAGKLAQKIKKKEAQEQTQKKQEEERSVDHEEVTARCSRGLGVSESYPILASQTPFREKARCRKSLAFGNILLLPLRWSVPCRGY